MLFSVLQIDYIYFVKCIAQVGLKQLVSGKRKCMKTLIKSHVDVLDLPVTSREVEIVALLMVSMENIWNIL